MKIGDRVKVKSDFSYGHTNTYIRRGQTGVIVDNMDSMCLSRYKIVEVRFDSDGEYDKVYSYGLELITDDPPEYYEYIGGACSDFTKGKIYKIKNPDNLEGDFNFIDDNDDENGFSPINHQYFKPSTKKAFNKQNNMETEFIIPKQWHIDVKTPEQAKVVGRWFDQSGFACSNSSNFYENNKNLGIWGGVRAGNVYGNEIGTKITYEQFEKYILKQNNKQNNMKIIGYKSPMKIGIHAKGELYIKYGGNDNLYIPDSTKNDADKVVYSVPKEIVETWEPVYKETSKTLVLGTSRIKVVISKGKIDVDNENEIKFDSLNEVYRVMSGYNLKIVGRSTDYTVSFPKVVKIGCSEFELSEIKLIIDTYNELNK
jgi:hypothetical protein